MSTLLHCQHITKEIDGKSIFASVDLSINKGQMLSLVGPSGCGKTTLLRCIAGLDVVTKGRIALGGVDITYVKPEKRSIVMMFQHPLLFPHMTILDNVVYGLKSQGVPKKIRKRMGEQMLEKIQMNEFGPRYPFELSGGQKQRVALARALILKPDLLLLDEPFSNLDQGLRDSIRRWVRDLLVNEGITSLFVTHDKQEAMLMGDQLAVMKEGKIQQIGEPAHVYQHPQNRIVADFFSEGIIIDEQFIPLDQWVLKRHSEDGIGALDQVDVKPTQRKQPSEEVFYLDGIITGQWMQHGQRIYQVDLKNIAQEMTIFSQESFSNQERVKVCLKKR